MIQGGRAVAKIGRRRFLVGAGTTTLVAASGFHDWLFRNVVAAALTTDEHGVLTASLYRPADQLWLRFEFVGLTLDGRTDQLVADGSPDRRRLVRVVHPAQHVAEASIGSHASAPTHPLDHRVAGPSHLVFEVEPPIPFDARTLLGLAELLGTPDTKARPSADRTHLELPTHVALAPRQGRARADLDPMVHGDVSHLHRTVLTDVDGGPVELWALENLHDGDDLDGRYPTASQRHQIVAASAAGTPLAATRLWLTPHGAHADIEGRWPLIDWVHEVRNGRDEFVEVTTRGHVLPFGHAAAWIDTVTRRWTVDPSGGTVAVLVEEQFVVVEPSTVDLAPDLQAHDGRAMPFASISIEGHEAIPATKEAISLGAGDLISTDDAWIARRDHPLFPTHVHAVYTATDVGGNPPVTFSLPIVFVTGEAAHDDVTSAMLGYFYSHLHSLSLRTARPRGDVAWAPEREPGSGATTAWTTEMVFSLDEAPHVDVDDLRAAGAPSARPVVAGGIVRKAELDPPGVHPSETTMEVAFPERWLLHGDDPDHNPDGAFLQLLDPRLFPLGTEARAAMSPDIVAETLNQTLGVGPVLDVVGGGGSWDPAKAFGETAQILRGVLFSDLVGVIADVSSAVLGVDIPNLEVVQLPDAIRTTYEWCPENLKSVPAAGFLVTPDSRLCVKIEAVVGLTASTPTGSTLTFSVSDFTLAVPPVLGFVELDVALLRAVQPAHGATDFVLDVVDWRLGGDISWLQPIVSYLSGGGKNFDIDVGLDAIDTALTLPVPGLNLGLVEVTGISIEISSSFPFRGDDRPTVGFAVGAPNAPVNVSLMQFTGQFFCRVDFSSTGLEQIRARVAVSADLVSIDVKVATANVTVGVMAEFRLADGNITFTGELWMEATFDVMGVIGASLKIVGQVVYRSLSRTVTMSGRIYWSVTAIITVKGNVKLGEIDFALGNDGSGGGGGTSSRVRTDAPLVGVGAGGTSFGDQHDLASWTEYVGKFAA